MADLIGNKSAKEYFENIPQRRSQFDLKGLDNVDWGMKDRMSKIFNPKDNRSLMLAFDHGYFMGSTQGLERIDIQIQDIAKHVDALMGTRGAFRTSISPTNNKAVALRVSSGSTMASEDITKEIISVDIEDAIRMNAACMAVQTFIGTDQETNSLKNLSDVINAGNRYSIPTMGVVAVGKTMERTSRFFLLATRVIAELGAQIIKTYYCDDFEKVVAACPVPIVVAGGKKLPEKEALELAYKSINSGAAGVDMGRNIFQSESPEAMVQAVAKVVHENFSVDQAFELYNDLKNELTKK
ncbi:MAG TPA: 3-hydroxy-5-phosphonooxypentane-2,4-dione thiolase [Proteiniclasticum sp.]|uniref:Putative autoinducer-2 (AI-2) aldolase n=1 Tax=Proteiniclasticum ruminis TaxID=398199 RepID=A0A1I5CIY9_9CLOT|nr:MULTISPECIES: 3-hydroxy-5-phosphonooxypentane-2,4-dione thiolase [Proteiniclasticum]SFN86980.1 putative autoinducer-2 (AI-2) aldolase [Proteiniclasticum ruminis]HBW14055.1 3-hydroxy-5-phosphonooxypentane-2,4-dione thiolase [Proteiniclasticum sp.]